MAQHQHYLPQVYLRPWCVAGRIVRYRRVRTGRLDEQRKVPRGVAFEPGLYSVPAGARANGLAGDDLEVRLAADIDQKIPKIVSLAESIQGEVADDDLAREIKLLMRVMSARNPTSLARSERWTSGWVAEHRSGIERMAARALTAKVQGELSNFLDPRMPTVAARAALAAIVDGYAPEKWLDGVVHVVQRRQVLPTVEAVGIAEFPTFDEPIVEWEGDADAPLATFALTPALLVVVTPPTSAGFDHGTVAVRHAVAPIPRRRALFCSRVLHPDSLLRRVLAGSLVLHDA